MTNSPQRINVNQHKIRNKMSSPTLDNFVNSDFAPGIKNLLFRRNLCLCMLKQAQNAYVRNNRCYNTCKEKTFLRLSTTLEQSNKSLPTHLNYQTTNSLLNKFLNTCFTNPV